MGLDIGGGGGGQKKLHTFLLGFTLTFQKDTILYISISVNSDNGNIH